jgi:hypothetical protein
MSEETRTRLPGASVSYPTCGGCHEETNCEDGDFYCDGCRLRYDGKDPEAPATFSDEDDVPCGTISKKAPYEKLHTNGQWYRFIEHVCPLPKGHKPTGPWDDGHYFPGDAIPIPAPADA